MMYNTNNLILIILTLTDTVTPY